MKRKLTIVLAVFFAFYVVGFFFIVPLMIKTRGPLRGPIEKINRVLYMDTINSLDKENCLREIWNLNAIYWCEHDERCKVAEEVTQKMKQSK